MPDVGRVPVSGSLSAKVIRACPEHARCALDCPKRQVEDLGTIAHFGSRAGWLRRMRDRLEQQHGGSS